MKSRFLSFLSLSLFLIGCSNVQNNKELEYSILKGVNYSQQKEYSKAMSEFQKAYELDKNNLILLKEIAYCYYQFGDFDRAEKFWLRGLEISPKDDEIIKNLATLYYEQRELEKSSKMIEKIYNHNDEYYLKLKASILYELDKNKAYEIFKKLDIEKFDVDSSIKYIKLLKELDKRDELYYFMRNSYPYFKNQKEYILEYTENLADVYSLNEEAQNILLNYLVEFGQDERVIFQLNRLYIKDGKREKAENILKLISQ